ncbi:MAG TPA: type IV pilus secretin PilQ [Pyrinomonadaceae bacterium]|jgi:type IV pilus assembly protein PilQ|nr:type IV pilus secretin PilQ [Pyrinomonadaceae bacterium]
MKSLIPLRAAVSKIVVALFITACLVASAAAQQTEQSSQGKHFGDPGFRGEPINLNVVNADIRDILSYITDQYGINFVIDRSVKEVPVTVKVNDVPWNVALESVLQAQELGVQVNGNILRVADNKTLAMEGELVRERNNNQLDTSPLVTELIRLNYATASGALGAGQTTSGLAAGGANNNIGSEQLGRGAGGDGLLPIIKRRLSRRGSIEIDSRSNSLIITDVPTNIKAIRQLIDLLDQPEPQVEIEARIVVATRNFSRDIGVQLGALLSGANRSGIGGGTLPATPSGINMGLTPNPSITNDLYSKIANTAIGLTTGVFGTAQLSAIISAGEQKGEAKVIATPRVTALNNRPAEIKSGTKIPVTTVQPGSGTGSAVIASTTYIEVPLRLAITPQITDLGTVILNVVAENSSTAAIVGNSAPAINTQSMTTQVTVPDGGTTVVGGVLFDDERQSQDRTPGLAGIPLLGNLFKRKGVTRNTNEILFFITPRITRPDSAPSSSAARNPTIIQPVPMGNPPSNSDMVRGDTQTTLPGTPGMARPEPAAGATNPIKP